jgi:Ni,Fe-hydrogenase I large subunit
MGLRPAHLWWCTTVRTLRRSARGGRWALPYPTTPASSATRIAVAQFVQDHVMHFYHLHGLDWVDVVSALSADPSGAAVLQAAVSPSWPNNTPEYFQGVLSRLQTFAAGGQLGLFANGYWGHPAYKLSPEANLLVVAHFLEALDWQREVIKIHAILGGKNPNPQTYLVGGVAVPIDEPTFCNQPAEDRSAP